MNKSSVESLTEEDKILTILRYFLSIISLFPRVYVLRSVLIMVPAAISSLIFRYIIAEDEGTTPVIVLRIC